MRLTYKINNLIFGFVLGLFFGCTGIQNTSIDNNSSIKILKRYAEKYNPKTQKNKAPNQLPLCSEKLKKAIFRADSDGEKYLTLIILKLYKTHLECCNQAYELRRENEFENLENPILIAFLKITKLDNPSKNMEFIPSSISYDWVMKNKYLYEYFPINQTIKEIDKLIENIRSGTK